MNKKIILLLSLLFVSPLSLGGSIGEAQQDGKKFIFSASAVYGSLSDGTLDSLEYADVLKVSGLNTSSLFNVDSRWGYSISAGYLFGPELSYDLVLTYTNIKNHGSSMVSNSAQQDIMLNRLGLFVQKLSGQVMRGPAIAAVNSNYDYQTADLITHRAVQSKFAKPLHYTRYYGAKATEIEKGFTARYSGASAFDFGNPQQPLTDNINFEAKFKGIGPKAGGGVYWDINRFITVGGDISLSVLTGSSKSHWSEVLETTGPDPLLDFPNTGGHYAYFLNHPSSIWLSPVLGANLVASSHVNLNNGSVIGIEGGIGSEQYWSMDIGQRYGLVNGANKIRINERFAVRNAFVKASFIV
ncbi:Lpg1974 family pore-forming outer membrane protein [Legionella pneumophila serogroup 1]